MSASIRRSDGRTGALPVVARGGVASARLLRTVNESICPDPRNAPVAVRVDDKETTARVSIRCSSETPAGMAAPLTFRRVTAAIVQRLPGCTRGKCTPLLTTGVGGVGTVTGGVGAGDGVGATGAQASNRHGPTKDHTAGQARDVMRWIPLETALDARDLTESRRPISRVLSVPACANAHQHRTVIPLGVQSPTRSSSLPAARRLATSLRDGSSLAAYLALLRLGFTEPPSLPKARWALTPPFHPYRTRGFPRERRFAFCCTVRRMKLTPHAPRRYLAVYPVEPGLSSVPGLSPRHRDHPAGDRSVSDRNITDVRGRPCHPAVPRRMNTSRCQRVTE